MYINFLLLSVTMYLLLLTPLKSLAEDCWVGSLKIKVNEKNEHQHQTKVETYSSFHNVDAEGQVMFNTIDGQLNIVSKNISGYWSSTFVRDTGCVHHEGHTKGILTEGIMSKVKIHVAYWRLDISVQSTVKNIKGCMQNPIQPIKDSEEQPDWRFEGIVDPNIGRLMNLCSSVKSNPELGYCNRTSDEFSGRMIRSSVEGNEVYEWYAKRVPCKCSALITDYIGDVKINGNPISGEGGINLSDAIVQTGSKSSVTIKFGDSTIKVGPNSSVDLTDVCQKEKEKPSVLELIVGSIRSIVAKTVSGGQFMPFIYKGPNAHAGVRGTDFILISGGDKTVVMVLDGEVSFWDINKRKTVKVKKNQKSECEKGGIPTNPVFFNSQEIPEWFR
jgi:hypothetical protein